MVELEQGCLAACTTIHLLSHHFSELPEAIQDFRHLACHFTSPSRGWPHRSKDLHVLTFSNRFMVKTWKTCVFHNGVLFHHLPWSIFKPTVFPTIASVVVPFWCNFGMAPWFFICFLQLDAVPEQRWNGKLFPPVACQCSTSIKSSYTCNRMYYCYWQWPHWSISGWPSWQLATDFTSWVISSNGCLCSWTKGGVL